MLEFYVFFMLVIFILLISTLLKNKPDNKITYTRRRKKNSPDNASSPSRFRYQYIAKPDWVKKEIIRLKVHMMNMGCRKIADELTDSLSFQKT